MTSATLSSETYRDTSPLSAWAISRAEVWPSPSILSFKTARLRWRLSRADSRPSVRIWSQALAHLVRTLPCQGRACGRKCSIEVRRRPRLSTRMRASPASTTSNNKCLPRDIQGFSDLSRNCHLSFGGDLASAMVPTSNELLYVQYMCPFLTSKERGLLWMPQSYALGACFHLALFGPHPPSPGGRGESYRPCQSQRGEPQEPGGASLTDIYQCRALTLLRKNLWFGRDR